jgi:hypothetical protein
VQAVWSNVAAAVVLLVLAVAPGAGAQTLTPQSPGPLVFDIRGTTLGVPQTSDFYPTLPADTIVPARGFGLQGGAHFYPWHWGSRSVGIGADVAWTRASVPATVGSSLTADSGSDFNTTLPAVAVSTRVLSPQLSLNFGTSRGWSYLTAGAGGGQIRSEGDGKALSRSVTDVNAGAGARWFLSDHLGVGFDLRMHWIGGTSLFAASAGFSFK